MEDRVIGARALMQNQTLLPLAFLLGHWQTAGSHPLVPGKTLAGRTSFGWHEGGAFVIMHSQVDEAGFPDGIAVIGSDGNGRFAMSYFDERGVSRIYDVDLPADGTVTWFRDDAEIAQRVTIRAEADGTLVSTGRIREHGGEWADDLSQVFTRIDTDG